MTTAFAGFVMPGCLLLLTLASGLWLSRAGKPLKAGIFTVHKLLALAAVVATAVQTYGGLAGTGSPAALVALLVALAGVLALFVTGALMSMNRPGYRLLLTIHNLAPGAVVLAMTLAIYLLTRAST